MATRNGEGRGMLIAEGKVLDLERLRKVSAVYRADGKRVVLCHGVFDVLHHGHLTHLRQAKAMGDVLVVSITADRYVSKGPGRPAFTEQLRAEMLAALEPVDHVAIVGDPSAVPAIDAVKPYIYCKGPDYKGTDDGGNFPDETRALHLHGGRIAFTDGPTSSSSTLINRFIPSVSAPIRTFLDTVSAKYGADGVIEWLDKAEHLTAIAMGEPILDEYIYVTPEGKSAKEAIITYRRVGAEQFRGGIDIVAGHLGQVVSKVRTETAGIRPIVKRRFVVQPFLQKVFSEADLPWPPTRPEPLHAERLKDCDLVVVVDFGHGLVGSSADAAQIAEAAPFLALSVQSNSLNWGFNLLSKWPRADYVVVDEQELRLAQSDRYSDPHDLIKAEFERMKLKVFALTRGHNGCLLYDGVSFVEVPALADRVVDRMGAGDAFIAVTAPLARLGAPMDILALVGNVAGGIEVGAVGNQPVKAALIKRWVRASLK
ncbi:MAG: adenylyltransferase/cytidyltransferase family protein [Chloroflexi bacterium]|nr:adenylyltransferase/cytidyltransferase family protein [Chloroflexota bacterium]